MESFLRKNFRLYSKKTSLSPAQTASIAAGFAGQIKPGHVTGLMGELGAGKTHFVKGAAGFFGFRKGNIVSPTFNLVKEHKKRGFSLFHFDLYRLKDEAELEKTGYREYITAENAVTFIEWPDRIKETWKDYDWVVVILHKGNNKRDVLIYKKDVKINKSKVKSKEKSKKH